MNAEGQYYTMPGCGQLYGMTQRMLKIMMVFLPVDVIVGIVVGDVGGGGMQLHWVGPVAGWVGQAYCKIITMYRTSVYLRQDTGLGLIGKKTM